jgi:hypothetical protein
VLRAVAARACGAGAEGGLAALERCRSIRIQAHLCDDRKRGNRASESGRFADQFDGGELTVLRPYGSNCGATNRLRPSGVPVLEHPAIPLPLRSSRNPGLEQRDAPGVRDAQGQPLTGRVEVGGQRQTPTQLRTDARPGPGGASLASASPDRSRRCSRSRACSGVESARCRRTPRGRAAGRAAPRRVRHRRNRRPDPAPRPERSRCPLQPRSRALPDDLGRPCGASSAAGRHSRGRQT